MKYLPKSKIVYDTHIVLLLCSELQFLNCLLDFLYFLEFQSLY